MSLEEKPNFVTSLFDKGISTITAVSGGALRLGYQAVDHFPLSLGYVWAQPSRQKRQDAMSSFPFGLVCIAHAANASLPPTRPDDQLLKAGDVASRLNISRSQAYQLL